MAIATLEENPTQRKYQVLKNFGEWKPITEDGRPSVFSFNTFCDVLKIPMVQDLDENKQPIGKKHAPAGVDPGSYHQMLIERGILLGAIIEVSPNTAETPVPLSATGIRSNKNSLRSLIRSTKSNRSVRSLPWSPCHRCHPSPRQQRRLTKLHANGLSSIGVSSDFSIADVRNRSL